MAVVVCICYDVGGWLVREVSLEEGRVVVATEDAELRRGNRDAVIAVEEVRDSHIEGGKVELPRVAGPRPVGFVPVERFDIGSLVVVCLEGDNFGAVIVERSSVEVGTQDLLEPVVGVEDEAEEVQVAL